MKNIKKRWIVGLLIASLVIMPAASHAVFGIGDIVFDPTAFAQMLLEAFWWAEDLAYQVEQIANQVLQIEQGVIMLENWALSLKNLDFSGLPVIGGPMAKAIDIFEKAQNIFFNAAVIKEKFEELYAPFHGEMVPSGEYFRKSFDWNNAVRDAHFIAMQEQSMLPGALHTALRTLEEALTHSEAAEGHLQAQQAGNQLLGTQIAQQNATNSLLGTMANTMSVQAMQEAAALDQAQLRLMWVMSDWREWTQVGGLEALPQSFK